MGCAAQQSGGVASARERQVGVAVHASGVSRVPAQLGFTRRNWCGPPLGPQPEYAGQCGDHGETPPLAAEASKAASDRLMRLQVSRVSGKCLTACTDAARAV